MSLYENVQAARKRPETARVGLRYSAQDDQTMLQQSADGVPLERIALSQKRTTRAIQHRIAMLVVKIIMDEGMTLKEASQMYNVNIVLLSRTYQHERERIRLVTKTVRQATARDLLA